jgi:hypothetical protein
MLTQPIFSPQAKPVIDELPIEILQFVHPKFKKLSSAEVPGSPINLAQEVPSVQVEDGKILPRRVAWARLIDPASTRRGSTINRVILKFFIEIILTLFRPSSKKQGFIRYILALSPKAWEG